VFDDENLRANPSGNSELLFEFAGETRIECLSRLAFSARELPIAGKVSVFQTARHEKAPGSLDHCSSHDNRVRLSAR
jgi:hypothetical protein